MNGFVFLCEDFCVVEESNKENIYFNKLIKIGEEMFEIINVNDVVFIGKRSFLIEECDNLSFKGGGELDWNSFCKEKRNSVLKYICMSDSDGDNRKLMLSNIDEMFMDVNICNFFEGMVNFEVNDISV